MPAFPAAANRALNALADALLRSRGGQTLNASRSEAPTRTAGIAGGLRIAMSAMTAEATGPGGGIDYEALRESNFYVAYRDCAEALIGFDPRSLSSRGERLAFWINLYNALIIDAVIAFEVIRSVRADLGFFRRAAYTVGGLRYSADDMEHGILRGNRRHPFPLLPLQFASDDARLAHAITPVDPRVHCALSCASRSCPPIAAYDSRWIDDQLELAARSFVNGGAVSPDGRTGDVLISPIFRWYARDFGGRGGVREFLLRYLDDGPVRDRLLTRDRAPIKYQRYDWSLNRV